MTMSHPLDSSRLLTPMVTGVLPASKPVLARGQVYCGHDFRQRAVAWFTAQATGTNGRKANKTKRKTPQTPTRVQPARAAKRKADTPPAPPAPPAPPKRRRIVLHKTRTTATSAPVPASAYTLSAVGSRATPEQFQAGLDVVLDTKTAALVGGCHWSMLFPVSSSSSSSSCPIVAEPLACIDRAYCLHSIGRQPPPRSSSTPAPTWAPEAAMSPPCTPPPAAVLCARAKGFAAMRHVQERTVECGGLRFAVDVCDGSVRVWMV